MDKNNEYYQEVLHLLYSINDKSDQITEGIKSINEQIKGISNEIGSYKTLLEKQLNMAASEDEIERIIHSYSDVVSENITKKIDGQDAQEIYADEKQKLIESFCLEAWEKMDPSSQSFLISSKVMYRKLEPLGENVDYSGVCLLVTKALEVEMKKRFGIDYMKYMSSVYGNNYNEYPTGLLDRNKIARGQKCPISDNQITLGSFAYILCYSAPWEAKDKTRLLEFSRKFYFPNSNDKDAFDLLQQYAKDIEKIRKNYRNPTAHTAQLNKIKAKECMDLVIDVQKLLKRMLDSFAQ